MPRPLGWTPGEGRYKGLGSLADYNAAVTYSTQNPTNYAWQDTGVYIDGYSQPPGMPLNQTNSFNLDYMNAVDWFVNNPTVNPASMGRPNTAGVYNMDINTWVKQNTGLLLVGAVVGFLLLRR